ncbi:MAG TPA: glycosyltransferase [Planctomycetaceae bacterium]|nr:glycosyltransferase [Planctomycetaceae bacterium]
MIRMVLPPSPSTIVNSTAASVRPAADSSEFSSVGVVVIGRNEGERLRRCLLSVTGKAAAIVYVDSGSTDGSPAVASALGVDNVELDSSIPFSAARARNAGLDRLMELRGELEFVLFVDGDCEVAEAFTAIGRQALLEDARVAAVAGRLRERFPERSVYNRLCDMEWNIPAGETKNCGGIALFRVCALREAGGFNSRVVAGEEPELCVRLRQRGWTIRRLPDDMATHDADMTHFSQWWKRAVRAGHAYAEGAAMHGRSAERHFVRESLSGWIYGFAIPIAIVAATIAISPWALLATLVYPLLVLRIAAGRRQTHRDPWSHAFLYAGACLLAKPAECFGQARYWLRHALRRPPQVTQHQAVSRG